MPALSRLRFQTASVTLPSATTGKRSYHRSRSMPVHKRPSTPHCAGRYQVKVGSGGVAAVGALVAGACANVSEAPVRPVKKRRESKREIIGGWFGAASNRAGNAEAGHPVRPRQA